MSGRAPPSADRWRQIDQLMGRLLALPARARQPLLQEACAGDPDLRREVESLLAAHHQAGDFLESTVASAAGELEHQQRHRLIGQRVGPYRVLEEIGRGGMSVVYLASRDDAEFDRRVAIKVIKRGMDSAEIERRFRIERQILANLQHPNIARLYDGGTTPDGLPCFVMEHIDGEPIDRYCDHHRLSIDQRLELFRKVCSAVEHAHRNLVVHRDLKPSNVLVTADGTPKLLDFGIAKLLAPESVEFAESSTAGDPTGLARPTAPSARIMTPEYASPEQVRGEPVTTASDVYSLGVLLYELFTGRLPYRVESRSPADMERVICRLEPAKPSTSLGAGTEPREAERRAADRGFGRLEPLRKRLAGDLDNIVLKALRKEPARRYRTVAQLAEDLDRHRAGLTVSARPATFGYRSAKFVRRHRTAVVAAALLLLAILGGSLATAIQARRAMAERERAVLERERAVRERDRAEQVSRFMRDLFRLADQSAAEGASVTASEFLDLGVEEISRNHADQPEYQAALLVEVAFSYRSLGFYERSKEILEQALQLNLETVGEAHPQTAETLDDLGRVAMDRGDYENASELLGRALALRRQLLGPTSLETAESLNNYGVLELRRGDAKAAERVLRQALEVRQQELGPKHLDTAMTVNNLASALSRLGRLDEAESGFRQALETRRLRLGEDSSEVTESLNNLATALFRQGRLDAATELFRQVLAKRQQRLGTEHERLAPTLNNLAKVLYIAGRAEEAEPLYRRALQLKREHLGSHHPDLVVTVIGLAATLRELDRPAEAETLYAEALAIGRQHYPRGDRRSAGPLIGLGELYLERGEFDQAATALGEARQLLAALPATSWRRAEAESAYGAYLMATGRRAEGEPLVRRAYEVLEQQLGEARVETRRAKARLDDSS